MSTYRVGTSGWQYADWRGAFYPPGVPHRLWLEHYASTFDTVEVNASFYRLPRPEVVAGWRDRTTAGFCMALKASRFLTHVRRLRDPLEPVTNLLTRLAALGAKAGPLLLQLPPDMKADNGLLRECLAAFARRPVAVEFREPSWFTGATFAVLEDAGAALVWGDRKGRSTGPLVATADWGYLRLHEGDAASWPRYRPATLARWADALTATFDTAYAYCNNDQHAAAVADAAALAGRLGAPARCVGAGTG